MRAVSIKLFKKEANGFRGFEIAEVGAALRFDGRMDRNVEALKNVDASGGAAEVDGRG